ncbi:hypothetical protein PS925_06175 [Pseudomonas fluorescens]|uniref:Uncharacterized protein n=1 Tax=Pseudomonas fluorescens TaxID=294 RepID=A0A5E7VTT5_PSEFL|nr:hypothetical protein PS925_06175 [Pseudomonas fluorescens]
MAGGELAQLDRVAVGAGFRADPLSEDLIALDRVQINHGQGGAVSVGRQRAVDHAGHLRLRQFQAGFADLQDVGVDRFADGVGGVDPVHRAEQRVFDQQLVVQLQFAAVDGRQVRRTGDVDAQRLFGLDVAVGDRAQRQVGQVRGQFRAGAEPEQPDRLAGVEGGVEGDFNAHQAQRWVERA